MDKLELSIPAQLASLAQARSFIGSAAQDAHLSERGVFRCQLAVDEACSNIIEHGFGGGEAEAFIHLSCWTADGCFYVTLTDSSTAFDPLQHPDPDISLPLDQRPTGGLGVFFIKRVMDEVRYQRQDNQNILTMGMRLQSTS